MLSSGGGCIFRECICLPLCFTIDFLPQEVLYDAVRSNEEEINNGLTDCCGVNLLSIEKPPVSISFLIMLMI